jgi:eukaryotic-like serine/threonine-protein kinase
MELVEGPSLADLLARRGRLGVGRTLSILRQLSAALAAAHEAGVVHRDVKPANVLVRPDGVVKITDFGIAASAASAALTETGQVVGTARYLSPEQARGKRGTPASDVYALGLVGYECLAGHPAFDGPDPVQVAARQVTEPPPPLPPDVPEPVRGLVQTATAKDPARRLPDGAALRDALDRVLESGRSVARSTVPPLRAAVDRDALDATTVDGPALVPVPARPRPGRSRRPRWPFAAGGVLLCALAAVLALVGLPHAAGSPGTVRAGLGAATTGGPRSDRPTSGGGGAAHWAGAGADTPVQGAAGTGGTVPADPTGAAPTVVGGVRSAGVHAGAGTAAAGAGTAARAATTGRPGTTTAAEDGAATGTGSTSDATTPDATTPDAATSDGSTSDGSTPDASTPGGAAAGGSAARNPSAGDPTQSPTDSDATGSGETPTGPTAGPTDGGATGSGTSGSGADSTGTGASGTDGTAAGTSGTPDDAGTGP